MLRTNHLRAPGDPARHFATECFIDELAAAANMDPLEYRLRQITNERMVGVLQAAAQLYGWDARPSPRTGVPRTGVVTGRGIAFGIRITYVGAIAEVEVDQDTGVITVKRVVMGHDCGMVVNPDSIRQQIEGQVIQTVGRALMEEVKFDQFRVTSVDWIDYPIIRSPQVPAVESVLIDERNQRDPLPTPTGGVGEPALNPVPPAIANAVFDATGIRLRQAPFTPERVKALLGARA
jgi:CO/xanthine dehydrogenase Mo-binding subunit